MQECIMRHSTVFQTAGCLRHVTSVEEKKDLVADYVRWYIIERNSSCLCSLCRFKDGLSALQFLTALQQHPSLLIPVLCHSEKRLTGIDIERLFTPDVKSLTLAYWADYLLDCQEGEAAVSVEEVLMFATGLTSLPPSGLEPLPKIEFLDGSPFPMSNTCSNLLKLPILDSYSVFKAHRSETVLFRKL
uniref:HECT domain-containing protein n=1 Tax=Takifugu rubripes TaxID=31033 RepID=A0A674P9B2_TAKRU